MKIERKAPVIITHSLCAICSKPVVLGYHAENGHSVCGECIVAHPEGYAYHAKAVADANGWDFSFENVKRAYDSFNDGKPLTVPYDVVYKPPLDPED